MVEDEPHICALFAEILEFGGFDAHCVDCDREAYAALRGGGKYDCLVLDVNLGKGTTGYDVARFARGEDPALPIIFVSGQTTERSVAANGVHGSLFLPKPFTPDELLQKLHTLVGDNDD